MTVDTTVHHSEEVGAPWVNATGLPTEVVEQGLDRVGRELAYWVENTRTNTGKLSMFDRKAYVAPNNPYSQMDLARKAVEQDDIVGGVADVTEALAFQGVKWESSDADDADIFNQISRDLNLDQVIRTWHREQFTYSQVVIGMWWGRKEYKVRGRTAPEEKPLIKTTDPITGIDRYEEPRDELTLRPIKPKRGNARRKTYDVYCPTEITFLDPMRVVPVGTGMFGQDPLAWHASEGEITAWSRIVDGTRFDPIMSRFFTEKYEPGRTEAQSLGEMGVDPNRLLLLNPDNVWRHTLTKPDYRRFPDLRLRGTFAELDLKQQLLDADRVTLVGAANYILLIKKGDKDAPGTTAELANLNANFKVLAKLPVIIADHRLNIEIITPKTDSTLDATKYDTLDRRILNRALGALSMNSAGQRNESTLTISRGVARLLESRRLLIKRELEKRIARAVVEHPSNVDTFGGEPNLAFTPRNVQLDEDTQIVSAMMQLRTQKEMSRETMLEFLGLDQEVEAQRREYEEESGLDAIFQTAIPFDSPLAAMGQTPPPSPQGGRPPGGGNTPASPAKKVAPVTRKNNPKTGK